MTNVSNPLSKSMSKSMLKQKGASTPLLILFLGMAAIIATIAFKLYPPFFEHWQIESVVDSFEDEKGLDELTVNEISKRFNVRLVSNNVRSFNSRESTVITKEDGVLTIDVMYEVRVPMYRNIDAIVKFEKLLEKSY